MALSPEEKKRIVEAINNTPDFPTSLGRAKDGEVLTPNELKDDPVMGQQLEYKSDMGNVYLLSINRLAGLQIIKTVPSPEEAAAINGTFQNQAAELGIKTLKKYIKEDLAKNSTPFTKSLKVVAYVTLTDIHNLIDREGFKEFGKRLQNVYYNNYAEANKLMRAAMQETGAEDRRIMFQNAVDVLMKGGIREGIDPTNSKYWQKVPVFSLV